MEKQIRKNKIIVHILLLFMIVSCDSNRVFDEYIALKNGEWQLVNPIDFKIKIEDTISKNNLFINIRNNKNYAFSNLFLITKMQFPNGEKVIDTLEYEMADKTGKFLGTGFTDIKENKLLYKENARFPKSGNYTLTITQAMRKNGEIEGIEVLKGVTDIGLRIEKTE